MYGKAEGVSDGPFLTPQATTSEQSSELPLTIGFPTTKCPVSQTPSYGHAHFSSHFLFILSFEFDSSASPQFCSPTPASVTFSYCK